MTDLPKLAASAERALAGARIRTLEDVAKKRAEEIEALKGLEPDAFVSLRNAMRAAKLSFRR